MLQRDDAIIARVSSGHRPRESPRKVKARSSQSRNPRLHGLRRVAPMLLALICLLSGALHQLRDLEVSAATFRPAVLESFAGNSGTSKKIDISARKVIAEHDADDSFSVTAPSQMSVSALVQPSSVAFRQPRTPHPDSLAEIETPPPRYLT
jgi:hypothetical protein